jgi:hypothetical protein
MRRVVVGVDENSPDDGWTVAVRTSESGDGSLAVVDLVEPYRMASRVIDGRRVPAPGPDRERLIEGPHAALCTGDKQPLTELLRRVRHRCTEGEDVSNYGRWLFECLLAEAWDAILEHPDVVHERAVELALRWPADAADLHRLVWEAMHDGEGPLAGHPNGVFAITRLVPAEPQQVRHITGIPSVLFATSVALSDATIRPGAMYMGLLRDLDAAGLCRARAVAGISADKLRADCARWNPDVVHLVAHGVLLDDDRGALMLHDDEGGNEREADAAALTAALSGGSQLPLAVVLSACNTASPGDQTAGVASVAEDPSDTSPLAAQLVAHGVPVVSAMAGEVSESACRLYTRKLAASVHQGSPMVDASAHGRRAALVASEAPNANIDWALPALFLAEYLDPAEKLIDATRAIRITGLANDLELRQEPVFIGREDILTMADEAVETNSEIGIMAVTAQGSTAGLGGTRLLREIGWRVLRDGHIPLFLGPFQETQNTPTDPRALVHTILSSLVKVTEKMELSPFAPSALLFHMSGSDQRALREAVEQAPTPGLARSAVRVALGQLRKRKGVLEASIVHDLLADDLDALARRAAEEWGPPFGEHTRTVLLCDNVHNWYAPVPPQSEWVTGVDFLLHMLDARGLGRPGRPSPVVLTSSTILGAGKTIGVWCESGRPGLRVLPLDELTPEEKLIGYQWVLLHPWKNKPAQDTLFRRVYTPLPTKIASWEGIVRDEDGHPTHVQQGLYQGLVNYSVRWKMIRSEDDEDAWKNYVKLHPQYRLESGISKGSAENE